MDIFKKWWFYVIAAAIVVSLPFAIRTAVTDSADPAGDAPPAVEAAGTAVDTAPGQEQSIEPSNGSDEGGQGGEMSPTAKAGTETEQEAEPSAGDGASEEFGAREENDPAKADGSSEPNASDERDTSTDPGAGSVTYVLNTNTKKFHYPTCSSVRDIKDKNRLDTTASREELIDQGYVPCKRCDP